MRALTALRRAWEGWVFSGILTIELLQRLQLQRLATELSEQVPALRVLCANVSQALTVSDPRLALSVLAELHRAENLLLTLAQSEPDLQPLGAHMSPSERSLLREGFTRSAEQWIAELGDADLSKRVTAAKWLARQEPRWLAGILEGLSPAECSVLAGEFVARDETEAWLLQQLFNQSTTHSELSANTLAECLLTWGSRMDLEPRRVLEVVRWVQGCNAEREAKSGETPTQSKLRRAAVRVLALQRYDGLWALVDEREDLNRAEWTHVIQSALMAPERGARDWLARQQIRPQVQSWELELLERFERMGRAKR